MRRSVLTPLFLLAFSIAAQAYEPAKIKVLVIDGQHNHAWRDTTAFLKDALETTGNFAVDVSSNLRPNDKPGGVASVPFPPELPKYQVAISNYMRVTKDGRPRGAGMDSFAFEMFGGKYGGRHGRPIRFKEGSADHPVVKGLDQIVKLSLTDRGYKHVIAEDVKVLVESEQGQPQVWVRKKGDKPRVFYFVHDPRDLQRHEVDRQMVVRALFWVTDRNEADYKKALNDRTIDL